MKQLVTIALLLLVPAFAGCGRTAVVPPQSASAAPVGEGQGMTMPLVDHHAHLLSERGADRINPRPFPSVQLPPELTELLRRRAEHWNERAVMAELYAEDAVVFDTPRRQWLFGRDSAATYMSEVLYARGYQITPFRYAVHGNSAQIAGYYTRGEGADARHFGHLLLSLRRGADGRWRIATETAAFPALELRNPVSAEHRVAQMDSAGIQRSVILSTAYWFGSPLWPPVDNELEIVRAENNWTAQEAARFPDRLIAFCSVNPLKDYAVAEISRCADNPNLRGLKLHFGNSRVNVRNPEHVAQLQRVFRAANERRLPIVAHLWVGGGDYGREDAEIFLAQLLPDATGVPVQIAHFAGGGPGYTDEALAVYAEAIERGDPRTRNLYFDIATVADQQTPQVLQTFAMRIRQVGLDRVLFGTDLGPPTPRQSWLTFRTTVPLTDVEFDTIARNVAPYLQ